MVLPLLLAAGGAAITAYGIVSSAAPSGGGAVETMLTAKATAARQCVYHKYPSLEIPATELVNSRLKGLINDNYFYAAMARNGINNSRSRLLLQHGLPLVSLADLVTAYYKEDIDLKTLYNKGTRLGYTDSEVLLYMQSQRSMLPPNVLLDSLWRGIIDRKTYYGKMHGNGYTDSNADLYEESQLFLPSHEDLIRFQVRDVYNETIVEKYGYDEEFPSNILPDAHKIGMSEPVMRNYWKAHWQLPSPTMVYDMVQRLNPEVLAILGEKYKKMGLDPGNLETTIETLKEMLKIDDYPKYWRDRMAAISYTPITRVDLRRIYQLGLCDDDFVKATLMERGYTSEDAALMLEFYKTLKLGKDKQLSEKNLFDSYNYGIITKSEITQKLHDIGYDDYEVELKLEVNKRLLADKDLKEDIKVWKLDFTRGQLSEEQVKLKLTQHSVPDAKANIILNQFRAAKTKAEKLPPLTDMHKFYTKKLLDETGYRTALAEHHIPERYIELYVQLNQPTTETTTA